MKVPFKHYVHDDDFWESFEYNFEGTPVAEWSEDQKEELREKIRNPFYEIGFECEVDTETGQVTILKVIE